MFNSDLVYIYIYLLPEKVMLKSARKSKLSSFSQETSPIASTKEVEQDSRKTINKRVSYRSPLTSVCDSKTDLIKSEILLERLSIQECIQKMPRENEINLYEKFQKRTFYNMHILYRYKSDQMTPSFKVRTPTTNENLTTTERKPRTTSKAKR